MQQKKKNVLVHFDAQGYTSSPHMCGTTENYPKQTYTSYHDRPVLRVSSSWNVLIPSKFNGGGLCRVGLSPDPRLWGSGGRADDGTTGLGAGRGGSGGVGWAIVRGARRGLGVRRRLCVTVCLVVILSNGAVHS